MFLQRKRNMCTLPERLCFPPAVPHLSNSTTFGRKSNFVLLLFVLHEEVVLQAQFQATITV